MEFTIFMQYISAVKNANFEQVNSNRRTTVMNVTNVINVRKVIAACSILAIIATFSGCAGTNSLSPADSSSADTNPGAYTYTTDALDSETPSLADVLSEVQSKFTQEIYEDSETGVTLPYNLFVPENYDSDQKYPMITFIHDDSIVGKDVAVGLTQGYGGVIWATESEQAKHASFVLVPVFQSSVVAGGAGQTGSEVDEDQLNAYLHLLSSIQDRYSIDANRLYITGQSMGCMTSFYLNGHYPDLFAATLYVSGQWDVSQLSALGNQKFFYITAGGDGTASGGQTDVEAMLTNAGTAYSTATWDATWTTAEKNAAASEEIANNTSANFATWKTGTVMTNSDERSEHRASFNYGYTVPVVRDWIFSQSK
jgi:predicted peptidase